MGHMTKRLSEHIREHHNAWLSTEIIKSSASLTILRLETY